MSFMSGHELCEAVEAHLKTLGYKVFGDSSDGWCWELGDYQPSGPACDSQGEAAVAALADVVQRTVELLDAAETVIQRWEQGDLSEAVRELGLCLRALRHREEAPSPAATEIDVDNDGWLLHGDDPTGPWTVGAYLDKDDAYEAATALAKSWIESGQQLDLEDFDRNLGQDDFVHLKALDVTVWIDALPIEST